MFRIPHPRRDAKQRIVLAVVVSINLAGLASWSILSHLSSTEPAPFAKAIAFATLPEPDKETHAQISGAYGKLPLSFEVNTR